MVDIEQLNKKIEKVKEQKASVLAKLENLAKRRLPRKVKKAKREPLQKEWQRLWDELKELYKEKKELSAESGRKKIPVSKEEQEKVKDLKSKKKEVLKEIEKVKKDASLSKEEKKAKSKELQEKWQSLMNEINDIAMRKGEKKEEMGDRSFLEAKPVKVLGKVGEGVTKPEKVLMSDGSTAIMKKSSSTIRVANLARGMNMKVSDLDNEVIAYKLDRLLGLNVVPPTKLEEFEGEVRSFQKWIKDTKTFAQSEYNTGSRMATNIKTVSEVVEGEKIDKDGIFKILLLDYLTQMEDRHTNNIIFSMHNKEVYAIDNGYAYHITKPLKDEAGNIFASYGYYYKEVVTVDKKIVKQVFHKLAGMSKEDITKAISVPIKHTYGYNDKDMEVVVENLIKRNKGLLKILEG